MTDDQKLHKMMANPGPAPAFTLGERVRHFAGALGRITWVEPDGAPVVLWDNDSEDGPRQEQPENLTVVDEDGSLLRCDRWVRHLQHGTGKAVIPGTRWSFVWFDVPNSRGQGLWIDNDDLMVEPSPDPGGTSGETEGRHREAWHQLVEAWRGIEFHPTSSNSAHMQRRYAEGALVMYLTLTGQDEETVLPEIGRALDDLYGTDRDKRGVPC